MCKLFFTYEGDGGLRVVLSMVVRTGPEGEPVMPPVGGPTGLTGSTAGPTGWGLIVYILVKY